MRALIILLLCAASLAAADVVVPADKVEDSVNIRQAPDATSAIVGALKRGDALPHVGSTGGWHEVRIDDTTTGFVSAAWSRVEEDGVPDARVGSAAVVEAAPELQPEPEPDVEAVEKPEPDVEAIEAPEVVAEPLVDVVEEPAPEPELDAAIEAADVTTLPGPARPEGALEARGDVGYLMKLRREGELGNSQLYDDGNRVGIATAEPQQRLDVNGSIQIHDRNSNVAGLMITQASGDTGYIMHNRANTLTIGAGSIDRITIDRDGNVGIGVARPAHALEMASGAHVTAGGVWTNRSSRRSKENIAVLATDDALDAVMALEPVTFNYVVEENEQYVGFVAEDVPELLAMRDGESLSPMDVVAALTKVVQQQQRRIEALEAQLGER